MKRNIKLLLFILLLIPLNIFAEEIDLTKTGNINIIYKYGDTKLSNSNVYIYKIATLDKDGSMTYTSEYQLTDSFEINSASKWNDLAKKINEYINNNNINYLKTCTTDNLGTCQFNNLEIGLYLIVTDKLTIDDYEYNASPSLIRIPNYNQIDYKLMYDIDMILKSESRLIKVNQEEEENMKICTTDCCYPWIIICIIMLIIIIGLIAYIVSSKRKADK